MAADARIQSLRATLEEERDSLRSQLSELGYGAKGLDYDPNFADSSQVTAERGENEALVNKLVEGLKEVEHALEKLGTDAYGVCEKCGQEIAPARLEARPEARLCIDCAAAVRR
jgi:DnaK suppressor protein